MEDFYANKEFFGASFSPDQRKILVASNLSGIYNAYAVPVAGGEPEALTASTTDAIFPISYFPADERFLYSADQGGNELAHIYVRNADGSVRDLTPGTKHQANFVGWAGNDSSFFIMTNERDQRVFDPPEHRRILSAGAAAVDPVRELLQRVGYIQEAFRRNKGAQRIAHFRDPAFDTGERSRIGEAALAYARDRFTARHLEDSLLRAYGLPDDGPAGGVAVH